MTNRNLFRPSETGHAGETVQAGRFDPSGPAARCETWKSHVSQVCQRKTVPRSDILHFLADVLQVDPDWLLAKDSTANYTADTISDPAESFLIHLPLPFPRQKQEVPLCENLKIIETRQCLI